MTETTLEEYIAQRFRGGLRRDALALAAFLREDGYRVVKLAETHVTERQYDDTDVDAFWTMTNTWGKGYAVTEELT